jgi:hypothetical protein
MDRTAVDIHSDVQIMKLKFMDHCYLRLVLSHCWFATVQEVLQADWHDVWHSPQPLLAVFFNVGFAIVLMCFILFSSFLNSLG